LQSRRMRQRLGRGIRLVDRQLLCHGFDPMAAGVTNRPWESAML
jgi:hypothetical protein